MNLNPTEPTLSLMNPDPDYRYDDLSVGCSELRQIAEAAQKGKVLPEGKDLSWLNAE